jgi:hypothetical protein
VEQAAHQDQAELMVPLVVQVHQAVLDHLVRPDQVEHQVVPAQADLQAHQDQAVVPERLEVAVLQDHQAQAEHLVQAEQVVLQVPQVRLVQVVVLVQVEVAEHQAVQVHQDQAVQVEVADQVAPLVHLVLVYL